VDVIEAGFPASSPGDFEGVREVARKVKRTTVAALARTRGRKPADPLGAENAELRRRAERAEAELLKAQRVIEVQGNVSALLGDLLEPKGATESTER